MTDPFTDDGLVRRLKGLSGAGGAASSSWTPAGGRSVDGRVVHDSQTDAMEAVRSTTALEHRQLIVEADGLVVALDVTSLEVALSADTGVAADTADTADTAVTPVIGAGARGPDVTDSASTALGLPGSGLLIRGQIVSGTNGVAVVQFVTPAGEEGGSAVADEFGEFELRVEAGEWMLCIADDVIDAVVTVVLP